MKRFIGLAVLIFIGVAGWRIGERLSADALGMALGILFGVMAGIPAALMVLAANRRENMASMGGYPTPRGRGQPYGQFPYAPQPPVIVMAAPPAPAPHMAMQQGYGQGYHNGYHEFQQPMLPGPHPQTIETRQFKVVGEKEEWVEDW